MDEYLSYFGDEFCLQFLDDLIASIFSSVKTVQMSLNFVSLR